MIRGRTGENAVVKGLLELARQGSSGALVVCGEAGIGKTSLLRYARESAEGFGVSQTVGVESEVGLAYAGLHQLISPFLDRLDALPAPQRTAFDVALGLRSGEPPDRFLVGLATLSLVADVAEQRPLLLLVDDAQWIDTVSVQVLAFVARRLQAEPIAVLFALRDPPLLPPAGEAGHEAGTALTGIPELRLAGVSDEDARELLRSMLAAPLDDAVRDRIVAESRGNPLALRELARVAGPGALTGGFGSGSRSTADRVEERLRRRIAALPEPTRHLLLVAAADQVGDAALLWAALARLGVPAEAAEPAQAAELIEIGTRVRFAHPLVRSAAYAAVAPADRRRAHAALAEVTDPRADPDRRAWHRAQAVLGTDEDVAADLEASADRALTRGGVATAAAFLQRATALTFDPAQRARRALDAAALTNEAGDSATSLDLLAVANAGPLEPLQRARAELLYAENAFVRTRSIDVEGMLLDVAKALAPLDATLSRDTYLRAIEAAVHAGPLGQGRGVLEAAEAARDAPAPAGPTRPADLLLDGLVVRFTQGYEASVPALRTAVQACCDALASATHLERTVPWLACRAAIGLVDDDAMRTLTEGALRIARSTGALATLAPALNIRATIIAHDGMITDAEAMIAEESTVTQAIGTPPLPHARLTVAAFRGQQDEVSRIFSTMVENARQRGEGTILTHAHYALCILHNGLGNPQAALEAAQLPYEYDELSHGVAVLPELVEAAVHAGDLTRARAAADRLATRAKASGAPRALGFAARSLALTSDGPGAESLYRQAVEHLAGCMATDLARAHLVFGEWLRRAGRRREALEQLRTAHEMLAGMGADVFAQRAARELRACGDQPRAVAPAPTAALSPQELQIARLVATGATSKEVAAQLFLSPRTVEAHLRSVFRKLGISSRRQLRTVLPT